MLMDLVLTTPVKMATTSMKDSSCFLPLNAGEGINREFGKDVSV